MQKQEPVSLGTTEKMIRVEQNIAATFGKYLSFNETEFYKNMSQEEKKSFVKYLDSKKKKRWFSIFGLISPLILASMLKISITGNAIKEAIGESPANLINFILIALFVMGLILFLYNERENRNFDTKFNSHSKVFDKILEKKV